MIGRVGRLRRELRRAPRCIGAHLGLSLGLGQSRGREVGVAGRVDVVGCVHILESVLSGAEPVEAGGVVWRLLLLIGP